MTCRDANIARREILVTNLTVYGTLEPIEVRFLAKVDNLGHKTIGAGVGSEDAA